MSIFYSRAEKDKINKLRIYPDIIGCCIFRKVISHLLIISIPVSSFVQFERASVIALCKQKIQFPHLHRNNDD
jgi:hypothetical protein